jgi:O-antigen ligase
MDNVPTTDLLTSFRNYVWEENRWTLLLFGLIPGYVLVVPSLSFIPALDPYNEKRVLQIGLLLTVGVVLLASRGPRRTWLSTFSGLPRFTRWGLGVVLGLGVLSSALASAPFYAFLEVAHFGLLFVAAGVVASVVRRAPDQLQWALLGAVVLSGLLYAVYFTASYATFVFISGLEVGRETISGFGNIRFFNQYQTWTLPLFGAALVAMPRQWRVGRGVLLGLMALWWMLVFASNVRGTLLAMIVAAVGVWLLFRSASWSWIRVQVLALGVGLGLYYVLFATGAPPVVEKVGEEVQYSRRLQQWLLCLEIVRENLLLGAGPMHFAWPPLNFVRTAHPHNALFQWLAEWGLPSTLAVSGLVTWGGWRWIDRECGGVEECDRAPRALRVGLVASVLAGAAHALVSGLLVMPLSQVLLVLVGGWAWGRYRHRGEAGRNVRLVQARSVFFGLLLAAMAVVGTGLSDLATTEERRAAFRDATDRGSYSPRYWTQGYLYVEDPEVIERARREW